MIISGEEEIAQAMIDATKVVAVHVAAGGACPRNRLPSRYIIALFSFEIMRAVA